MWGLGKRIKVSTKAAAVWPGRAGDGCKAGGGVQTGWFSPSPLAGLLNNIDGVRLEGQTHIDLDDAARATHRSDGGKAAFSHVTLHSRFIFIFGETRCL